jgi:LysR family transcriptional regulator, pca operon transcriptional activator
MVISLPALGPKQKLSRIRHRHLTCFLEIARRKKVSAAAEALSVTQPAASKTLRELEEILDAQLFERGGKGGLKLTAEGSIFLRYAGASIAALKEGLDGLAQAQQQMTPLLSIGALPTVATHVMPAVVNEFKKTHSARIRLITAPNIQMLDQLRVGELDLVVGRLTRPELMHGLSFTHLYSEQLVFAVRPGHALLTDDRFDPSMLEDLTLLIPTSDGIMRPVVDRFLIANGVGAMPNCIEARSPDFCRQYVLESDAIWIISKGVIEHDIQNGTLCTLDFDTIDTRGAVGLTTRADAHPSPTLRLMMDTVARVAQARILD